MSRSRLVLVLLAGFMSVAHPSLVNAQQTSGWYAGVEGGWQQLRFEPDYTFVAGGTPSKFDNRAAGAQWDVLFGHREVLSEQWALGVEAGVGFNRTRWSLEIPDEPASLEYTMPYDLRVAVLPERRIARRVGLFGSIGIGATKVRELKTSPTSSRYDVQRTRPTLIVGGGLKVTISPRAQMRAEYRYRRLAGFAFDTFDPAGSLIEHVVDHPISHGVSVGVTVGF